MSSVHDKEVARATSASGLRFRDALLSALAWLIRAVAAVSCLIIAAALFTILYAVAMRYFVDRPINWADEINGYLIVAMVMFGIGATLLRGGHIGIDLLTEHTGPRVRRVLDFWSCLAVLLFAGMFGWSAWHTVAFNRDFGTYSTGYMQIEIWLVQSPMVVGAVFLALAALVRLGRMMVGDSE